jgi:hypothetical protein
LLEIANAWRRLIGPDSDRHSSSRPVAQCERPVIDQRFGGQSERKAAR